MDVVLARPKIIEVAESIKIVEGPIKGGNKIDHEDLKGDKIEEKVLSESKEREEEELVKNPRFSEVKEANEAILAPSQVSGKEIRIENDNQS